MKIEDQKKKLELKSIASTSSETATNVNTPFEISFEIQFSGLLLFAPNAMGLPTLRIENKAHFIY